MSQKRPQSPESLPPQSQVSAPGMTRNITHLGDELAQHRGVQRVVTRILKSTPNTWQVLEQSLPKPDHLLSPHPTHLSNLSNSHPVAPKLQLPHLPRIWPLQGLPRLSNRALLPHVPRAAGPALTSCAVTSRLSAPAFCSSMMAESNRSWESPTVAMAPLVPTCCGSTKGVVSTGRTMGLPSRKRTACRIGSEEEENRSRASIGRRLHGRSWAVRCHPPPICHMRCQPQPFAYMPCCLLECHPSSSPLNSPAALGILQNTKDS